MRIVIKLNPIREKRVPLFCFRPEKESWPDIIPHYLSLFWTGTSFSDQATNSHVGIIHVWQRVHGTRVTPPPALNKGETVFVCESGKRTKRLEKWKQKPIHGTWQLASKKTFGLFILLPSTFINNYLGFTQCLFHGMRFIFQTKKNMVTGRQKWDYTNLF